ncbi:MAG: hypothetical protein ABW252_17805 [Polyangiales bacterium]
MGAKRLRDLHHDRRGSISTEYLVVTAVGLFITLGLGALGVAMVDGFGTSLQLLYADTP